MKVLNEKEQEGKPDFIGYNNTYSYIIQHNSGLLGVSVRKKDLYGSCAMSGSQVILSKMLNSTRSRATVTAAGPDL